MTPLTCSYEEAIARAARSGLWTEALQEHVAGCRLCRDTAAVAAWLKAAADLDDGSGTIPDEDLIWLRSRSIENDDAVEKTLWPVRAAETIGVAAALAAAAAGLLLRGPDLIRALPGAIASGRDVATAWLTNTEAALPAVPPLVWPVSIVLFALIVFFSILDPTPSED